MTTKKKPVRLPSKLSALLRLAVKDAKAVEKMKGYRLKMNNWHAPNNGTCEVCMAGAVMAKTLKAPRMRWLLGSESDLFTAHQSRQFDAIDDMRCGEFARAAESLRLDTDRFALELQLASLIERTKARVHKKSGRAPWSVYLAAADELERSGL